MQQFSLDQRTDRPLVSSIVEGEIRGLAKCWGWGAKKIDRLDKILSELVRVDAGIHDIILAYSVLYADDQQGGHSTGENDLWIAATAKATGAILLTCDGDFRWMNQIHLRVEIVSSVEGSC